MKYNRLTISPGSSFTSAKNVSVQSLIDRLVVLENKIENGELISTVQSEQDEQEIAYFVKHNAEVRKQAVIEFAVKLKKKADSYNYEENYIDRSVMYTDIDDIVTEVCRE